jgi:hypothetical protein
VLSYSYVGVFATPLPGIPRFSPQFLAKLFDDEFRTQVGIAEGNLIAQLMGKPPQPLILFGPARFQVQHVTIAGTAKVLGTLMQEAYKLVNQQMPLISVMGLNTEHEWIKPAFKPSTRWLADHYVSKGLRVAADGIVTEAINLQFRLLLKDPERNYSITLQPRGDVEDGVFAAINDHREWNQAVPNSPQVEKLLKESGDEINVRVTPIILGGVADD